MNKKVKAFFYNFISFAPVYLVSYFFIVRFNLLEGIFIPIVSAVLSFLLSPKFQVVSTNNGDKIYMKWLFKKGVREVE